MCKYPLQDERSYINPVLSVQVGDFLQSKHSARMFRSFEMSLYRLISIFRF
jgi:hypothetical protein